LEFRQIPSKHIVVLSVKPLDRVAWSTSLRTAMKPWTREALVFVHGYNVTFETAARRTAQLAYDLNFRGVPLMYSWPSKGILAGYPAMRRPLRRLYRT
jgi:esterase/lipase superfamily enzyme